MYYTALCGADWLTSSIAVSGWFGSLWWRKKNEATTTMGDDEEQQEEEEGCLCLIQLSRHNNIYHRQAQGECEACEYSYYNDEYLRLAVVPYSALSLTLSQIARW